LWEFRDDAKILCVPGNDELASVSFSKNNKTNQMVHQVTRKGKEAIVQKSISFGWFAGMIVALVMFAYSNAASASEFTADMIQSEGGDTTTGKIYVKDSRYRMDLEEDGREIFVIVDQNAGVTRVVMPEEKMYMELGSQEPASLMNDPFQGSKYTASTGDSKHLGTETVNGYQCDKYLVSMNGQDVMTQWVSQKLGFPIKIVMDVSKGTFVELRNIQEGPVDDALFDIPSGYTERTMGEPGDAPVQTPDVAEEAPTPPGDKARIAVGEIKSQASGCSNDAAAGIGEMLSSSLANNDKFIVLSGGAAELEITGAVTRFEPEVEEGGGLGGLKKKALGKIGAEAKSARIVMEVKLKESSSGRILKAESIEAKSTKWDADMSGGNWVGDVALSGALGVYSNEPMEKAIRGALAQTVDFVSKQVPQEYYRYTGEEQYVEPLGSTPEVAATTTEEGGTKPAPAAAAEDMTLYTKYDFVPGDKVIFYDDMKDEEEGEFPYRWNLDHGVYEVVRLGKEFWIMCTNEGSIRPKMPAGPLPAQYTAELEFYDNGPEFSGNCFDIYWMDSDDRTIGTFEEYSGGTILKIHGNQLANKILPNKLTKGVHTMRIMATKRSIKCYVDEERVANVPKVENFNPVGFRLGQRPYRDPKNPTLFRGFRFAEGGKSMREQLDETGKIVTHGILFDVDSHKIKGESYKTLKDIGQLLQDDPELRLSIEGHTDSDGSDEHNLTLSHNRASSVRDYLISTYSIKPERLEAKGWGESKPMDTNDTAEGKANNRRVELVKL
jgi:OOP family OmpA-OmpF porin